MGGLMDRFKRQQQPDPLLSSPEPLETWSQTHSSIEPPQVSRYQFQVSYDGNFEGPTPQPFSSPITQPYPNLPVIGEQGWVNAVQEPEPTNQKPSKDYNSSGANAGEPDATPNFNTENEVGGENSHDIEPPVTNIAYSNAVQPHYPHMAIRRSGGHEAPYPEADNAHLYPDDRELAPPVARPAGPSPTRDSFPPYPEESQPSGMTNPSYYDVDRPTCSLNLVCYRSGQEGCKLQQIRCTLMSKYPTKDAFDRATAAAPHMVTSDDAFFLEMRRLFESEMCGFFRRYFSLKTHKAFRILSYTPTSRPRVVPFDGFIIQEMMYAYRHPDKISHGNNWIKWVFRLRRADKRHAVEFVEGWDSTRISVAGIFPWLGSCIVAVAWTAAGGDPQTTFTVASFILTSSSIILALLAIVSSIESSGNNVT